MFGFQRIGDLAWAAGDMQARGFLLGGTAGRTTLAGEGLQHQDGHSPLLASTIPNCIAYDPAYAYELAIIIHAGMKRMFENQENVFYYLTVMNENYLQPPMPEGCEEGVLRGIHNISRHEGARVQLFGSGTILREAIAAQQLLDTEFGIETNVWSVTSYTELRREAMSVERWNLLHPEEPAKETYLGKVLADENGPVVAASDYMKIHADQVREFIPQKYYVLGTDGFGRSDSRANLRDFFEVNRYYICIVALKALADEGSISPQVVSKAMQQFSIDPDKPDPLTI